MRKKPLSVVLLPSDSERFPIDPGLLSGLGALFCPDNEYCSIHVKCCCTSSFALEGSTCSVMVFLEREREVRTKAPWILDRPKNSASPYIYAALFQDQSREEVIGTVKDLLEL